MTPKHSLPVATWSDAPGMSNDDVDLTAVRKRFAPKWARAIECRRGGHRIIAELDAELIKIAPSIRYFQIKEKYGRLRVYVDKSSPEVAELIREAERQAAETCEQCGAPGRLMVRNNSWYQTLCTPCAGDNHREVPHR